MPDGSPCGGKEETAYAMTGWAKENCSPCYGIGSVDCKTCHRLGKCQIVVEPVMMALEVAAQKLQTALHASLD